MLLFPENWGYENLSFDEFLKFANSNQSNQSKLSMHKVMFGDKLVGFLDTLRNLMMS